MSQKHVISFQVERSTTERLAELARRADRSRSAEIRRAIREHIDHQLPGSASSHPEPAARDETSLARQSNSSLPVGSGEGA